MIDKLSFISHVEIKSYINSFYSAPEFLDRFGHLTGAVLDCITFYLRSNTSANLKFCLIIDRRLKVVFPSNLTEFLTLRVIIFNRLVHLRYRKHEYV